MLTEKLTSIADAIREKGGTTEKLTLDAMPTAIANLPTGGGGDCNGLHIPEEYLTLTGSCQYRFYGGGWDWFIEEFGEKIKTKDITNVSGMFQNSSKLKRVPFSIETTNTMLEWKNLFVNCNSIEYIERIPLIKASSLQSIFESCSKLRELPVVDVMEVKQDVSSGMKSFITYCYSLREIPDYYMECFTNNTAITSTSSHPYYALFRDCSCLNEAKKIRVNTVKEMTSNIFSNTFYRCYRLKGITFDTLNDNGTPLNVKWKNQTIDLSQYVGWAGDAYADQKILDFNSGITADKEVVNKDDYNRLKDDPDWWSRQFMFSRFGHDAAVELINTLPDASAYIEAQGASNNIVKFYSNAGSAIDGGSVSALTEEEIAVAAAKGWSIAYTTG